MVIWFELAGFLYIRVRVNGVILYSIQNFKLYNSIQFNKTLLAWYLEHKYIAKV